MLAKAVNRLTYKELTLQFRSKDKPAMFYNPTCLIIIDTY